MRTWIMKLLLFAALCGGAAVLAQDQANRTIRPPKSGTGAEQEQVELEHLSQQEESGEGEEAKRTSNSSASVPPTVLRDLGVSFPAVFE